MKSRGQGACKSLRPYAPRPTPPLHVKNREIEEGGV
nr:MAG TPA: hypothetical protein [Caudoviricetes sp.]